MTFEQRILIEVWTLLFLLLYFEMLFFFMQIKICYYAKHFSEQFQIYLIKDS
jgi:hypothetical protein